MRVSRRQPRARKPRRPRDSRTIPIIDETKQGNGRYYHCFNCGFTCNDKRDTLGGESTPNGVVLQDFAVETTQTQQAREALAGPGTMFSDSSDGAWTDTSDTTWEVIGTTLKIYPEPGVNGSDSPSEYRGGGLPAASLMLGGITLKQKTPIMRSDSSGNPVEPVHYHTVSVRGGCPLCGSFNWRGDY